MRMLDAHVTLLRAELAIFGRELGIIVGLAVGALFVAILVAILLYVGSFLFFGEWLFGSMGWGIIHGTLLGFAIVGFVGVNLGGGDMRAYGWGAVLGVIVTIGLGLLLVSNWMNDAAEWGARFSEDAVTAESLPFGEEWRATIVGTVVGAVIGLILGLIVVWRAKLEGSARLWAVVLITIAGLFAGAILASTRYQAPEGVFGFAIMVGLLTWILAGLGLAAHRGFDPEARYADLIPRESIEAFKASREFLKEQWQKQKSRMMRR